MHEGGGQSRQSPSYLHTAGVDVSLLYTNALKLDALLSASRRGAVVGVLPLNSHLQEGECW